MKILIAIVVFSLIIIIHELGHFICEYELNKNVSVSLEGQRYNLQDISDNNGGNWSINAIISVKLD